MKKFLTVLPFSATNADQRFGLKVNQTLYKF